MLCRFLFDNTLPQYINVLQNRVHRCRRNPNTFRGQIPVAGILIPFEVFFISEKNSFKHY